jgi:hypothetical protein
MNRAYHEPVLKPQDLLVAMKLAAHPGERGTFPALGRSLGLSASEARYALRRAALSGLVSERTREAVVPALREFLLHGARYSFPAERGRRVRGLPTATSAPPLAEHIASGSEDALVWRYAEGTVRGESISPIYPSAPQAAALDPKLHRLLALLDGVRVGGSRVRSVAMELLARELE